tara:strand:+ start:41 stop:661 length:621 start_codon:yes stop_codon:yes gene_type:complete
MNKTKKGAAEKANTEIEAEKLDYIEDVEGVARGYTQNFGPARQTGYQKGAAKVAEIMGKKGAADAGHGGATDHDHGDPVPVTNLNEADIPPTPRLNPTVSKYKKLIEQQNAYDVNTKTAMRALAEIDSFNLETSGQGKMATKLYSHNFNANTTGLGDDDVFEGRIKHVSVDKKFLKNNRLVKPRLQNFQKLEDKAKSIQGDRPSTI